MKETHRPAGEHRHLPATELTSRQLGIIMVDASLRTIAINEEAAAILHFPDPLHTADSTTYDIPEDLKEKIKNHSTSGPPLTYLWPGRGEYTCRICKMTPCDRCYSGLVTMLVLEKASDIREAVHDVAVAFNLTNREQEVLEGISIGLSNKEIGFRMNISPNTVRTFLRQMMVKMRVDTRTAILAKILGKVDSGGVLSSDAASRLP